MGIVIYYLILTAPFAVLFAVGYFAVLLVGRLLTKRPIFGVSDAFAPFAGVAGTVLAYLFYGLFGLDRFHFVSEHVRSVWQSTGWVYEMNQALFGGIVCGLVLLIVGRRIHARKVVTTAVAASVSFVTFCIWPILCSPFL